MLAPLNSTMIVVVLSQIIKDFHASVASVAWLVTSYLIVMASVQPVAGKLGDRLGRRRLVLGGLLYFAAVSAGAALAPNLAVLIAFRVQQAIAASIVLPNSFALIRDVIPAGRRAATFGMIAAATGLAAAAGPPIGGALATLGGWRALFGVNILLVGPALLIGRGVLPASLPSLHRERFDLVGAAWLLVALLGIALFTTSVASLSVVEGTLAAAVLIAGIAAFIRREYGFPDPVVQPRFFLVRDFAASTAGVALSNLAMYTTLLAVPILLTHEQHFSSGAIGLVLASMTACNLVLAPLGGRLADRHGLRRPVVAGMSIAAGGFLPLALWPGALTLGILLPCLGLIGVGLGLGWPGLQTASIEALPPNDAGAASGIFSTSRYLGSIVGSSVLTLILSTYHDGPAGFRLAFVIILAAAVGAVFAAAALSTQRRTS